jgi:hypothetical protein
MGTTFKRGQELSRAEGLNVFLKARDKSPRNAAEITYDIFDYTTGIEVLLPPSNRQPINPAIGEYYASFIIPFDANLGKYRIRWYLREFIGSQQVQILQEFAIVQDATQVVTVPGISANEFDLVRGLRVLLRDANPARNYHFMPPSGEESVNQFTRVFGYVWEDAELLEFLRVSNDSINMYPPQTFYETLDQLMTQHRNWRTLLLNGAIVYACEAASLNWIVDEFGYSIGGVSLDMEKSAKYQSMMNDAQTRFQEFVTQAKETVKIIRGLKQSRYGVGIRSSFGPNVGRGTLTPRRFLGI